MTGTSEPSPRAGRWGRWESSDGVTVPMRDPGRLVRARQKHKPPISQRALASAVDVHPSFIAALERGRKTHTYLTLAANIAEAVGVKVSHLFVVPQPTTDRHRPKSQ
jgi:DNA-binding XRE family transcriptional regulator